MPNFPVHNFGMDKMLEGVQGGLKSYVAGETAAFKKRQEDEEKESDRRFQLATKIFPLAFDEEKPYAVRKQAAAMSQEIYKGKGINIDINLDSMMDAAEVAKNLENAYLQKMAEFAEKDDWVGVQKLVTTYRSDPNVSNKNEGFKAYEQTVRTYREKKLESIFKTQEKNQPLTDQEKINLKTKADIGKSARDKAFERLSPEEQKQTVMKPEHVIKPEKVSGTLTEGSVKKSIDELSSFDVKVSAKLYGDYLKYRKVFEKTMTIDNAREQALNRVQQESQGIKPADSKSYDYLWK